MKRETYAKIKELIIKNNLQSAFTFYDKPHAGGTIYLKTMQGGLYEIEDILTWKDVREVDVNLSNLIYTVAAFGVEYGVNVQQQRVKQNIEGLFDFEMTVPGFKINPVK